MFRAAAFVDPGANGVVLPDATFRLGGMLGRVLFTAQGLPEQWTLKAVLVDGADVTTTGIDAIRLGPDSLVRVVLTDRVTALTGSVSDGRGAPVREYVVVVLPDAPVDAALAARYTHAVRPDQSGAFRLRALPPGRYVAVALEALEQGMEWDPVFQATIRPAARRFALAEGQALTLELDLMP